MMPKLATKMFSKHLWDTFMVSIFQPFKIFHVILISITFILGDSTCGQRALYQMGLTGIPIFNVNNNCATGSSALHMANQVVAGGLSDCVLAVGFEKMQRGSLGSGVRFSLQS